MRRVLLLGSLLLAACASAPPPSRPATEVRIEHPASGDPLPPAPPADPPRSIADASSPQNAARAFFAALLAGDRAGARALALSFDEMSAISKKVTDRARFDRELTDFIERRIAELSGRAITLADAKTDVQLTVPAAKNPEKLHVDVELARVTLMLQVDGTTHSTLPLTFLKTAAGWRFSTKSS